MEIQYLAVVRYTCEAIDRQFVKWNLTGAEREVGVSGRAALSAIFLEDLLAPIELEQ